jgi:hypothetical protein
MPESLLPPRSGEVSDVMDAAKRVFRATLPKCLPIGMFAILAAQLATVYWLTTGKPLALGEPRDGTFWILTAVGVAGYQLLAAVLMLRQRTLLAGTPPDLAVELRTALARWPTLIATSMLIGVAMFVGTLALLLPGVFVLVCSLLMRPIILFEPVDPLRALERCVRLVRPRFWKVMATAILAVFIVMICFLGATAALGLLQALLGVAGLKSATISALGAACVLGIEAVAVVYFSALWLALYSAASSSA